MRSPVRVQGMWSQTTDSHTKRRLLFSGLEVKHENGGKDEALAQLATWIVAGMENTRKLWSQSSEEVHSYRDLPPMVGWTIVGLDWYTWVTFGATNNGTDRLYVVGPCKAAATDTRDVYGAFKLLKLCGEHRLMQALSIGLGCGRTFESRYAPTVPLDN